MITEDYCSFEIAKLLKEKGFDEPCTRHWNCEDSKDIRLYGADDIPLTNSDLCANEYDGYVAPTLQMAMKWLRDVHNIFIDIRFNRTYQRYKYFIFFMGEEDDDMYEHCNLSKKESYEETVGAAIKHCIENLI